MSEGSTDQVKWVALGKFGRPKGLRGELSVHLYNPDSEAITEGGHLFAGERELHVTEVRFEPKRVVVQFDEIKSRTEAESLTGVEFFLPRSELGELEEGEHYWCDLIGLAVEDRDGRSLGTLKQILATASNDVYVVQNGAGELLLPATSDVICEVSLEEGRIVVDPPEVSDEV